ncbi:hypothetical protein KDA23_01015, partial [Candidatus Saccharibacteria bacterium]|nr:hypothetical protein [Candidatus Saccharibacteria bacterium]
MVPHTQTAQMDTRFSYCPGYGPSRAGIRATFAGVLLPLGHELQGMAVSRSRWWGKVHIYF